MARIELRDVTKRWGGYYAVEHLDLTIEDNAFVTALVFEITVINGICKKYCNDNIQYTDCRHNEESRYEEGIYILCSRKR